MRLAGAAVVLVLLALVAAAPATAREERIARGRIDGLQAGGGWVSWFRGGKQFVWRKGEVTKLDRPFLGPFGTDGAGRGVGLSADCSAASSGDVGTCTVRNRVLPDGPTSRALVTESNFSSVDEHRGSFIVGFRGRGHPRGIYLSAGGENAALERLSKMRPGELSVSSRAMTSFVPTDGRLYAASRNHPHRWRLLARSNHRIVGSPQAEGRFAYWLEGTFEPDGSVSATRIMRVDPEPSDRHLEEFTPPRYISAVVVTRARLYYVDRETGDLYEFIHPPFHRGGEPIPLGR
ncbi:MAG TPA: hypothetical protein VJT75_09160 [Thermoleophilaceae bacterium]|nr:hypothetical protein [Thermoleophilaceae bacterium]